MPSIRCVFYLSLLLAVLTVVARGKTCNSHSQCLQDECCVTKSNALGGCRSKGCEGCPCQPEPVKASIGDMFFLSCPCSDGLSCVPEDIIKDDKESTVKYLNSTCKTHDDLLKLYKRLLEGRKFHPRFLASVLKLKDINE